MNVHWTLPIHLQGPLGQPVWATGFVHYWEGCCLQLLHTRPPWEMVFLNGQSFRVKVWALSPAQGYTWSFPPSAPTTPVHLLSADGAGPSLFCLRAFLQLFPLPPSSLSFIFKFFFENSLSWKVMCYCWPHWNWEILCETNFPTGHSLLNFGVSRIKCCSFLRRQTTWQKT